MKWEKKGLIYLPRGDYHWNQSHAQLPIVDKLSERVLRIYFGTRDTVNRTLPTYIEVDAYDPRQVLYEHDRPVMDLGVLGAFDDSGVMPSWIVNQNGLKYLYYIGWNTGQSVPYRNSIGLAVSEDGGKSFNRMFQGPIMDRTATEPQFCAAPCVRVENGIWRMWYLSCVKWELYKGHAEPFYHIKYAESDDGIRWRREGIVSIDFKSADEGGIVRSTILKVGDAYQMWYSYRGFRDYRTDRSQSYRIGFAQSTDGIVWERDDSSAGIDVSNSGWDSDMIAYPYVYRQNGRIFMMYNGNGFGATGFGYATLVEAD